jgi:hypothetical protein
MLEKPDAQGSHSATGDSVLAARNAPRGAQSSVHSLLTASSIPANDREGILKL